MSDILNDGLREQLAAALLGWGGGDGMDRKSRGTIDSDDAGLETPKAEPALGHRQGRMRGLIEFADEEDRSTVDSDIDADSLFDTSDSFESRPQRSGGSGQHPLQPRRTTEKPIPAAQKALPPLPAETPPPALASSQPEMSCRISRFPFSHPCEMPELMPDQEDMFGTATSPSLSGPATPSVIPDVFRPLTQIISPDLNLGPFPGGVAEPELHDRVSKMSTRSSDTSVSDGLGIIREEDDVNTDGVSLLTPTEVSFGNSAGEGESGPARVDHQGFLQVGGGGHWRSVSSVDSVSSGEWRPSAAAAARKSVSIFSRMRSGGRPAEEEYLEKRSLTPMQLSAPTRGPVYSDDDLLTPNGLTPTSPLSNPSRGDASTTSRFFQRMPWLGDSQPKKPDAVFGVDLKESIRVAPMKIRISHKGRSTSYRTFPLSIHKCCEFIRRAGGTDGNIFSSAGNPYNIANLKSIFGLSPSYGEHFKFEGSDYTVHDAARIILYFLEQLPKPLISPSVVKSWILLARQEGAIEPPCPRVETGLDFWTEALNRLPTANRNLTKHLLTLFAEVLLAAAGTITEADARQLASAVSRAMFHQDLETGGVDSKGKDQKKKPVRRNVQPTLALAFLIRKRGEYAVSLDEAASNDASKRESKMFLPSTKEIMEWKGAGQ
ncbi:hypothetical protein C8A00DRAFT_12907 [Chaetomidium leptoderma]|uniref:Rho-GAP domain-containing protein n=1 Tax=Chaetomidium leptoderma TaxID=669021 RepID=A0AAN6ZZP7_9PEZI|nr:hypothetical protein C8A00DRAFT_12907 [Chaetomidium leptoderma]